MFRRILWWQSLPSLSFSHDCTVLFASPMFTRTLHLFLLFFKSTRTLRPFLLFLCSNVLCDYRVFAFPMFTMCFPCSLCLRLPEYLFALVWFGLNPCLGRFHMTSRLPYRCTKTNETAAILVYQADPVGVESFSYVNIFFCSNKFT